MGRMEKYETNRLGLRSKERLTEAFFEIIHEKPDEKLSVKQLCEKANLSRPSFYAHYWVIEYIPREYLFNKIYGLMQDIVRIEKKQPPILLQLGLDYMYKFFSFWKENEELFQNLKSAGMQTVILDVFRDLVTISANIYFSKELSDPVCKKFILDHHAYVIFQILDLWLGSKNRYSMDDMIKVFTTMLHTDIMNEVIGVLEST